MDFDFTVLNILLILGQLYVFIIVLKNRGLLPTQNNRTIYQFQKLFRSITINKSKI